MNVYLTGVNIKKNPEKDSNKRPIKSPKTIMIKENINKPKEETNVINEGEISSDQVKVSFVTSKEGTNKSVQNISSKEADNFKENSKVNNNNFISKEDKSKNKKFISEKEFSKIRLEGSSIKKRNELMSNEIKNEYVEFIMLREPKYADFDKISEEYQKQLYSTYQRYNKNLLIIERKKEELNFIVSLIEKSLVNNYFLKDSSMLPVYEQLIEKVKLDILTKKQEHDGYHNLYEELYNKNYTIKRRVLDEIDIDTINNTFYDQYKILKNHAIVQVSKKQEVLNQIEEYGKKVEEDHEKELKQKNKILKDLRLHIEVFKEDEKDLINKLTKIKKKRGEITELIKEKQERNENIQNSSRYLVIRYHKSYISMNKIFRSVNAKNLDDVLLDVGYINHNFNQLKKRIIAANQDISDLNSEYTKLNIELEEIKKNIAIEELKNKTTYNKEDTERVEEIRQELKKLNEDKYKVNEIIQKNKGTFQQGIIFLFQNIKNVIKRVKPLRKIISPNLDNMIKKYKNVPFSVDYNNIDKNFLKNFAYIFFKFSHIIFYLYLNSMSSGINTNNLNDTYELKSLYSKDTLKKYEKGIKTSLETYDRRVKLRQEKQREINSQSRKRELEKQMKNNKEENNITTQNKIFKSFLNYLNNKNNSLNKDKLKKNNGYLNSRESSKNSNSFFFTGIDFAKPRKAYDKESSKNNSFNETKRNPRSSSHKDNINKDYTISFREKQDFLLRNENRFKNMFYRYQNILIKENEKKLLYQQKITKRIPRSNSQPEITRKINYIRNSYPLVNKLKHEKDEKFKQKQTKPKLMDENYEYDEDENDLRDTRSVPIKKNKTNYNFTFFKLNKDRANIYKKMNDLRKLQMAYFGGRFLNTHISKDQNIGSNNHNFDEFVSDYFKRQSQDSEYDRNKKRKNNFKKKLVEKISANMKLRDKTSFFIKNRNYTLKNEFKTHKTFDKFKIINNKINYSVMNKKIKNDTSKNDKTFKKHKKLEHKKIYSKSVGYEIIDYNNKKLKNKLTSKSTKNINEKPKKKL